MTLPFPFDGEPEFDGETYDPGQDKPRMNRQLAKVYEAMKDGRWRTASEVAILTGAPAPSVQARLRDLRKARFGAYDVASRRRGGSGAVWEWRVGEAGAGDPQQITVRNAELRELVTELEGEVGRLTAALQTRCPAYGTGRCEAMDWTPPAEA
jgi:hypothetical protein